MFENSAQMTRTFHIHERGQGGGGDGKKSSVSLGPSSCRPLPRRDSRGPPAWHSRTRWPDTRWTQDARPCWSRSATSCFRPLRPAGFSPGKCGWAPTADCPGGTSPPRSPAPRCEWTYTTERGRGGEEACGQRADRLPRNRKCGGQRAARMGTRPSARGARHALGWRQWQDRDAYVHDRQSRGSAASRRKAAPRGLSGPGGGWFTRNQLIPGRVPRALPPRRGRRRAGPREPASERASRGARGALPASQEVPGTIPGGRAAPRLLDRGRASPGARAPQPPLRRAPSAGLLSPPAAAAAPPSGREGLAEAPGPPPPPRARGRAQHVPALGVGRMRRTRSPPRPRAGRRRPDTKQRPARGAAEYKLINTPSEPQSSRSPIRLQQVCSTRKGVTRARARGWGGEAPAPESLGKREARGCSPLAAPAAPICFPLLALTEVFYYVCCFVICQHVLQLFSKIILVRKK